MIGALTPGSSWSIEAWEIGFVFLVFAVGSAVEDLRSPRARRNRARRRAKERSSGRGTALDRFDAFLFPREST